MYGNEHTCRWDTSRHIAHCWGGGRPLGQSTDVEYNNNILLIVP